jgi:hypothetical protein
MATVKRLQLMDQVTKVGGKTIKEMGKEKIFRLMDHNMKADGKMT